jgi:carboxyl-terminal processing protease
MPQFALRPVAILGTIVVTAAIIGAQAPSLTPQPIDQQTAKAVVKLLERHHIAKPTLNDEIAKKWCRNFIKTLDPRKVYFDRADVDAFVAQETTLDDKIKEGDLDFPKFVFDRFLKRSDERLATAKDLLKQKPDFTLDESIVDDPDLIDFPADAKEANDRLRKQIKYEWLSLKIDKVDDEEIVKRLTIRYRDRNRFWHQVDTSDLLEFYLTALTTAIDPHSNYMNAKTLEDMMDTQLHLSLEGIGASLQSEDGFAVVKEVVPGGAADKDGRLQPEDRIVAIVKDGEEIDLVEKKLADVVRLIRGPRGTKVVLVVVPDGSKERKTYELTREKIELKEQHAKGDLIEVKDSDGKVHKIGVIRLPAFYGDTEAVLDGKEDAVSATRDCRTLLRGFKKQQAEAVLLDLQGNGGGLLTEAVTLSGLFIDHGPVVQMREEDGIKHLDDDDEGTAWDGPLAVLIDHHSASASEIFAGVIRDYSRGLIIGDSSTFGKGTVQSILPLDLSNRLLRFAGNRRAPLGGLKLTIQQFYRANGESTQIRGVPPHVHIPSILDQVDVGEGKLDNALEFDKVPPLPHDSYNRVPSELVGKLQTQSDERRKTSEKFQKQGEQFKKIAERKKRHTISLNEQKFRSEYVPDDDENGEDKVAAKPKGKGKKHAERKAWDSDFYSDEVMAIVADYLTLGSKALAGTPVRAANK